MSGDEERVSPPCLSGDFSNLRGNPVDVRHAISQATYPELVDRSPENQADWIEAYLTTILQRDVRSVSEIEKIPRLLRVLAARAGSLLNDGANTGDVGLNPVTCKSYLIIRNHLRLSVHGQCGFYWENR